MAKKEFRYKGKTGEELKTLTIKEFEKIAPARIRRTIQRGFRPAQEAFLKKLREKPDKKVRTHCRDIPILPEMIGRTLQVYNGRKFKEMTITAEMIGHYLGEFAHSRANVSHSSPGVGATRSSGASTFK